MKRRHFLSALALSGLGYAAYRYWPDDGFINPCEAAPLPGSLAKHPLIASAWQGINPSNYWDTHVHLIGTGDSDSGIWVNPAMFSAKHPLQSLQRLFYFNASCADESKGIDHSFITRLLDMLQDFPSGAKLMLLAFDYFYTERGEKRTDVSSFYTPNEYAQRITAAYPQQFEWIASIHPYRKDALPALEKAIKNGARAIKWLPAAQGMDPASSHCDAFYAQLAQHNIPLLVHAGAELAVEGGNTEDYGNPLRLRRPLDLGVKVLVAHCASLGNSVDLDQGENGPLKPAFELFSRLMEEAAYKGLLFGELSAVTQINRSGNGLKTLLTQSSWQPRLVNGSDYPLPGILPLFSLKQLKRQGMLAAEDIQILNKVRRFNPLLFDFILKRRLNWQGSGFSASVFESRRIFR